MLVTLPARGTRYMRTCHATAVAYLPPLVRCHFYIQLASIHVYMTWKSQHTPSNISFIQLNHIPGCRECEIDIDPVAMLQALHLICDHKVLIKLV